MNTEHITDDIARAASIILAGGLAAVPTETVYGLAGNGLDERAVERIYEVKGRPARKPLSLLVSGPAELDRLFDAPPPAARALAERFWPGPLTVVCRASDIVPDIVRAGGATVGLRCPDSEKTLALLRLAGVPLAAPSANPSGAKSPVTAAEAAAYFDGRIEAVIDGGPCTLGTESTVAALGGTGLQVLRTGALPEADIRHFLAGTLRVIGLTGGTGSGKSTALGCLRSLGALVIDADAVYHDLLRTDRAMLDEIDAAFPGVVESGQLQRKKLGAVVFADPAALARLRSVTEPRVDAEIDRLLSDHAAAGGTCAAVDAINILGTPLEELCSATVGILAPADSRIRRLTARDGISAEYARMRIEAQPPDSYYTENCTHTIVNDSTEEDFRRRCEIIFKSIMEAS